MKVRTFAVVLATSIAGAAPALACGYDYEDYDAYGYGEEDSTEIILGFSADEEKYAYRVIAWDDGSSDCSYPKFDGRRVAAVELRLCAAAVVPNACKTKWRIRDRDTCTSKATAKKRLAEAKAAFTAAGVAFENPPELTPIEGATVPQEVMAKFGVDAPLRFLAKACKKKKKGPQWCYVAKAKGYFSSTLSRWTMDTEDDAREVMNAYLSPNQRVLVVETGVPDSGEVSDVIAFGLQHVASRLLNVRGFDHHKKKDYVASAHHFGASFAKDPDFAQAVFNLACAEALLGKKEQAIASLGKAIGLNKKKFTRKARKDKDFDGIRADPAFAALVGR